MINSHLFEILATAGIQLLVVLLLAPLVNTFLKKLKAMLQGRKGPPLFQGYYDLLKYFRKESVRSTQTSWVFTVTPLVMLSSISVASLIVPAFMVIPHAHWLGGIVTLIYLFGLGRFFMLSAALEPGSGFCGMATSREMMLSSLIEPAMLLGLFVIALIIGSTNLEMIFSNLANHPENIAFTPSYILAILAFLLTGIAEMARVPFDNPETHYELTMIHEGMLLEYSGKQLGMMFWAAWMKQLLILCLIANFILPFGFAGSLELAALLPAFLFFSVKLMMVCVLLAVIETTVAKMRLFRVVDFLGAGFVMALLALVLSIHQDLSGGGF